LALLTAVFLLAAPRPALAYIGPGAGFAVAGSLLAMFLATLSAALALFTWPLRYVARAIRGRRAFARSRIRRCVILGLDGLDPDMTDKFLAEGKLPNLATLRDQGCYTRLQTTVPAISPVAWSSFQTGSNPGKHNIFDFLTRDRRTYVPRLSSVDLRGPRRRLRLGRFVLPLGKPDIRLLRKGVPFWKLLGEHGIFSNILRVPVTFPPEKFRGVELSGMCVPDLRGTQGTFSFYTTRPAARDGRTGGEVYLAHREDHTVRAELIGCDNPFRADPEPLRCRFTVRIRDGESADLRINGRKCRLRKGIYSDWIQVAFKAAPGLSVHGICKFLLIDPSDDFKLYVTPVHIDPAKPAMPISHPRVYATYLAKRQGPYATLGLAEDSWALNEKLLDDEGFIQQSVQIDAEREKMFFDALDKVKRGLCVCVFDGTDRIQHTFWRELDSRHPAHAGRYEEPERKAIEECYRRMDDLVGRTMQECDDEGTLLMVLSDHGFTVFRYGVDLNRWLEENGYLTLKEGGRGRKHLAGVDWSETRAYAVGLAGIFLNLRGREAQGIVEPGEEAARLRDDIAGKLAELADPGRDQPAVKQVYNAHRVYTGPYKGNAPDLIVGYHRGYRASWETAVGEVTDRVFHNNVKAWSGDHCIDPALVPGVLFCNRAIETERPLLMDVGPTVLDLFGVDVPPHMDGKPLAVAEAGELEADRGPEA